jgi:hypothetical protein
MTFNLNQIKNYAKVVESKQKRLNPESFTVSVAGVTFDGREKYLSLLNQSDELRLERDRTNEYDCYAVKVLAFINKLDWKHIGYVPKTVSKYISSLLDGETKLDVKIENFNTLGDTARTLEKKGLNIRITTV